VCVGMWSGLFVARRHASLARGAAIVRVGRLFRMWEGLPRLGIAG